MEGRRGWDPGREGLERYWGRERNGQEAGALRGREAGREVRSATFVYLVMHYNAIKNINPTTLFESEE